MVTPAYPPDVGGVGTVVANLAEAFVERGEEVRVLAERRRHDDRPSHPALSVERFPNWLHMRRYCVSPGLWTEARRIDGDIDVINAHSFHASSAMGVAATTKAPFVFTPHYHGVGHTALARLAHIPYDPLARRLFDRSDAIVCVSAAEADLLSADYPEARTKIRIVANGVDVEGIQAAAPFALDRKVVLVAGRLEGYKNIDQTVLALPHLPADTLLVITGQGPDQSRLRALVQSAGVDDRVQFAGNVPIDTLRRWQRTAAVTVSLSRHEAFGLVMLEAVVAGGPALVSDIEAHRETAALIDGRDVHFVPDGVGPQELAAQIEAVMAAPRGGLDPGVARGVSWDGAAGKMLEVLGSVR